MPRPIGVLNLSLRTGQIIRYFQWYERYGAKLHSVGLNWYHLNNFDAGDHGEAYRWVNAMFQLIKAREPRRFVWLMVERAPDDSDLRWMGTMRLGYDGLLVHNVKDFSSHFDETRKRYLPYAGEAKPMVVVGFCGYEAALAKAAARPKGRVAAAAAVWQVLAPELSREEQRLRDLGYRGLLVDWRVVDAAVAQVVVTEAAAKAAAAKAAASATPEQP